jgi:hypothetical protein
MDENLSLEEFAVAQLDFVVGLKPMGRATAVATAPQAEQNWTHLQL